VILFEIERAIKQIRDPENETETTIRQFSRLSEALNPIIDDILIVLKRDVIELLMIKGINLECNLQIEGFLRIQGETEGWHNNIFNEFVL